MTEAASTKTAVDARDSRKLKLPSCPIPPPSPHDGSPAPPNTEFPKECEAQRQGTPQSQTENNTYSNIAAAGHHVLETVVATNTKIANDLDVQQPGIHMTEAASTKTAADIAKQLGVQKPGIPSTMASTSSSLPTRFNPTFVYTRARDRIPSFNWSAVYNRAKASLFFVMMKSKGKEAKKQIRNLAEKAASMSKKEMRKALKAVAFLSTGFVVGQIGDELVLLTTVHSLDHIYTASIPINVEQINKLFSVEVICQHYEDGYRNAESMAERDYAMARVLSLSCEKDLLLLAVKRADIKAFAGASCEDDHFALQLCTSLDDPTEECLMVSWPAYKPNTVAVGRIGVPRRVDELSDLNSNEYSMELLEIYMESAKGSSGAPLVNKSGQVIGMLHGGHGKAHSYFIGFRDLITFLTGNLNRNNFPQPAIGAEASTSSKRPRVY